MEIMRPSAKSPLQDRSSASILGRDGVPIRRVLAPLVRRLQQICQSMVAVALEDAGLVSLSMPCWCSSTTCPASASNRCPEALGIDRNNVSLIVDKLEGAQPSEAGCEWRRSPGPRTHHNA
jgi:hypothetical protein